MTDDDFPLDRLSKYARYGDDALLREFNYLTPLINDPHEAADQIKHMDRNDLAHLYAVMWALALRVRDDSND